MSNLGLVAWRIQEIGPFWFLVALALLAICGLSIALLPMLKTREVKSDNRPIQF